MPNTFTAAYRELGPAAGLPPELEPAFAAWYELLARWNAKTNLTRVTEPRRVVAYHLADCVPLARALAAGSSLLDIGSGPGVPGLIVAALRPDAAVTCADSRAKKAGFLTQAAAAMKLGNVRVEVGRAEELTQRFAVVTARAVAEPAELARRFAHLLAPEGYFAAFLSAQAEPDLAGLTIVRDEYYTLPADEGERRLALFRNTYLVNGEHDG